MVLLSCNFSHTSPCFFNLPSQRPPDGLSSTSSSSSSFGFFALLLHFAQPAPTGLPLLPSLLSIMCCASSLCLCILPNQRPPDCLSSSSYSSSSFSFFALLPHFAQPAPTGLPLSPSLVLTSLPPLLILPVLLTLARLVCGPAGSRISHTSHCEVRCITIANITTSKARKARKAQEQ